MKYSLSIITLLVVSFLDAQNLVLNPSFEDYKYCPEFISNFNKNVTYWSTPTFGTTDYFNSCSKKLGLNNYQGLRNPKSGNGFAGIYVYTKNNYKEYVQGQLKQRLEKGKKYSISFYISLADYATHSLKNIDILFTAKQLHYFESEPLTIKRLEKQVKLFELLQISNEIYFSNKQQWTKLEVEYIAKGFESFFTIGNFYKNKKVEKHKVLQSIGEQFSYYFIDDISIKNLEQEFQPKTEQLFQQPILENHKIYTFKNVFFAFNKATLLEASKVELNKLLDYLINNRNLSIQIFGHTDVIGLEKRNKELSEERAKAVEDYLILQGLDASRVTSLGFGSSKPISSNDTQEGRSQNRRVEFKLIDN